MRTNHFQHEEYGPVYVHHIYNLKRYQTDCPGAFCKLQEHTCTLDALDDRLHTPRQKCSLKRHTAC
ncbi:hypothetical protein K439DRAFT_1639162 [Ramaria rubella]|nr:hypothetical protein K439DRAFT_1639162 [Ramaria rubella]